MRALHEISNYVRTLPRCMLGLKSELCIFLIAFRWEAHIVKLNFIRARRC